MASLVTEAQTVVEEPPDPRKNEYSGKTLAIKLGQDGRFIRLQIVYSPDKTLVNKCLEVELPNNLGVQERAFTKDSLRQTLDSIISQDSPISADKIFEIWQTGRPIFEILGDKKYIDSHSSGDAGTSKGYYALRT